MELDTISNIVYNNSVCRICLQEVQKSLDLFSEDEKSKEILNMIYSCFQLIIVHKKYLPRVICNYCIEELNMANRFRLKCTTFDERYKVYCKQLTNINKLSVINKLNITTLSQRDSEIDTTTYDDNSDVNKVTDESNANEKLETNQNVLNNTKNNFKCRICNKVLKSKASLIKHDISMHQNRKYIGKVTGFGASRRYNCTKCSYSTPHSQTLVNHMRRHDGQRPYQCACGKSFTQQSSLTAHSKIHSSATYFTCTVCGKQFKHAFTMKNHLRVHDSGSFSCNVCQKSLKSKQSLRDHMYRHFNVRNYNCEDCGDTFVTSSELLNHRNTHKTEKKVECHLCGYRTHAKKNLIIHLKRHAGDKAFKCDICEVTFYTKGDLRRHGRVHTHEKPYLCPACAQRFTHSTSLNKHMHAVHGVKYKWGDFKWKENRKISLTMRVDKLQV